jgi:hypothetical protein
MGARAFSHSGFGPLGRGATSIWTNVVDMETPHCTMRRQMPATPVHGRER